MSHHNLVKISKTKIILLSLLLMAIFLFYFTDLNNQLEFQTIKENLGSLKNSYAERPVKTLALFVGLYVLLTSLSIPGSIVLTLLSGAIFGVVYGTFIVTLSGTVGATIAFFLSRYLFRDAVLGRFEKRYQTLDKKFCKHGKGYLFSLRLLPASPFVVINLLMGLTSINPWTYFWITFTGMLPGGMVYVYAGHRISEINSPNEILSWPIILLLTGLGLLPLLFKYVLKALNKSKGSLRLSSDNT
jgi:uncharacterized membrane protein YdjX (TVP38/TMEM64 family)